LLKLVVLQEGANTTKPVEPATTAEMEGVDMLALFIGGQETKRKDVMDVRGSFVFIDLSSHAEGLTEGVKSIKTNSFVSPSLCVAEINPKLDWQIERWGKERGQAGTQYYGICSNRLIVRSVRLSESM